MTSSQLTVLISSRNRRKKLIACLHSLLKSTNKNFQLLVVDQSSSDIDSAELQEVLQQFRDHTYIASKKVGKSKGLNEGLRYVHTPYVAFTDDDCLPDKRWISEILSSFKKHPNVSAVFGQTRPYLKHKRDDAVCPCTTPSQKPTLFTAPVAHWQIGYGNNMTIRLKDLHEINGFREWLGPGAPGAGAEDAACTLQLLIKKKTIRYVPSAIVFHDKWLMPDELRNEELSYITGEAACYFWLRKDIPDVTRQMMNDRLSALRTQSIVEAYWMSRQLFAWLLGTAVACFYSLNSDNNSIRS